jgi:hypothetical protein
MSLFSTRHGALAGIVGGLTLVVAGFLTGTPPAPDDKAAKFLEFMVDHRAALRWQAVLFGIAMILIFAFTAVLTERFHAAGMPALHAAVPLAGLAALTGIAFAGVAPAEAVLFRDPAVSPELAQFVWDVNSIATCMVGIAGTIIFVSSALMIMKTAVLPRWSAYVALAAAGLNFLTMFGLVFDADTALAPGGILSGVAGLVAAAVWIVSSSVAMLRADAG